MKKSLKVPKNTVVNHLNFKSLHYMISYREIGVYRIMHKIQYHVRYYVKVRQKQMLVIPKVGSIYWGKIDQGPIQILPVGDNTLVLTGKKMSNIF